MNGRRSAVRGSLALAVLVGLAGLGPACSDDEPEAEAPPERPTTTVTSAAAAADPVCEPGSLESRSYILCTAGDDADQGLVVALHGRNSTATEMQEGTRLEVAAAAEGLAVVYPDAVEPALGWDDDTFKGDRDVAFLGQLVATLQADPRIGDGPVGLVGFSNGASMVLRFAAERPDAVEGAVAVAGQLPRDPAIRPTGAVPLMEVYGTADPLRGYDTGIPDNPNQQPGQPTPTLSTPETVAAFVEAMGATPDPVGPVESDPDPADGTSLRTETWTDADDGVVVLHTIVGGGHTWPSSQSPAPSDFGAVSRDLDMSAEAITFIREAGRS